MLLEGITNYVCQLANKCDITALLQVILTQLVSAVIKECLPADESHKESHLADCLYTLAKELEMENSLVKIFAR
jgi:hypothetical protein